MEGLYHFPGRYLVPSFRMKSKSSWESMVFSYLKIAGFFRRFFGQVLFLGKRAFLALENRYENLLYSNGPKNLLDMWIYFWLYPITTRVK